MPERPWLKSWPASVPQALVYRLGEQPLHAYLAANALDMPDATACIFYGRELSWRELDEASRRLAGFMRAAGIVPGDRVALYMQNCPQYLIAHYAVQRLGAVVCPVNPMFRAAELEYLLRESGARMIIAGEELHPVINEARAPALEQIVTTCYADFAPARPTLPLPEELQADPVHPADTTDLQDILHRQPPLRDGAAVDLWEDVSLMVFTSGTTGRPKGAMLTGGNALFKTAAFSTALGLQQDDISLAVAPLCHIAGMVNGVNMPVYTGAPMVLLTRFDPETVIQAFEKYRCTFWYSIAPMNHAILNHPDIHRRDLSSLRRNPATSFGMPVTPELAARWQALTGAPLHEASYGLSETHTCDTFMPLENVRFGSCGIPVHDTDIRIVDLENGADLPAGESGEIVIRNPGVFKGYRHREEATAQTLRDGWVHTGDVGHLDEDGYLWFTGRIKEMIKCSGYSVFPEDVEALLADHPAIAQSAVIGVPDNTRGESVKAFVVLEPAYQGRISAQEIIAWAREHMAAYKTPREVEFRDSLPATSAGKVLRRLLTES